MSRSRRGRDAIAPSLFPFLAVLLCTMGALVLILVLMVSGAQSSAQKIAKEIREQVEEAEAQIELAGIAYEKQLTEGRIELEKKRLNLQHLESHIQELIAELDDLKRTAELANNQSSETKSQATEKSELIQQLEKQLAEAKEEAKQKLDQPKGDKPIFAIIPYKGTNGTTRRPIYVECVQDGVILHPEGIKVSMRDLQPPWGPGNPLDAALRTVRAAFPPENGAVTSTAYPLLIVRPNGIESYALARSAMSGWDDQFGYELVDQSMEIAFPPSLPGLDRKIAQAMDLARERQAALIAAMPQKYRTVRQELASFDASKASWGAAEGTQAGEYSEYGATELASSSDGNRGGYASGDSFNENGSGSGATNSSVNNSSGRSSRNPTGPATGFANRSQAWKTGGGPDEYGLDAASDRFLENGGFGELDPGIALNEAYSAGGGQSSSRQAGTGVEGDKSQDGGEYAESGEFSAPNSSGPSSASTDGYRSTQQASSGASSSSSYNGSSMSASSESADENASAYTQQSQQMNGDPSQRQASLTPSLTMNRQRKSGDAKQTQSVAKHRGRNWAWSEGNPTQTPMVRSIRVQCLEDRWVVLPDKGSAAEPQVISYDLSPQLRAERLAAVVRDRIDQWGMAISGGYWKPVLVVEVDAANEWRYTQLARMMEGSGLEVQRRPAATADAIGDGVLKR